MKSRVKCLRTKLVQNGSILFVLLFLFISTAQLFHIHTEGHSDQNTPCEDKEQIQTPNKCRICDYYHHIQGQQIFVCDPSVETILNPEAITLNTRVLTGKYAYALQVIANKGPPNSH